MAGDLFYYLNKYCQTQGFNSYLCYIFSILGAVLISTSSPQPYIGQSFTVTYSITPFSVSAVISKDTITQSTCLSSLCSPGSLSSNVTFTPSAAGITVEFNPVSNSHDGNWQCQNSNGDSADYSFTAANVPSKYIISTLCNILYMKIWMSDCWGSKTNEWLSQMLSVLFAPAVTKRA